MMKCFNGHFRIRMVFEILLMRQFLCLVLRAWKCNFPERQRTLGNGLGVSPGCLAGAGLGNVPINPIQSNPGLRLIWLGKKKVRLIWKKEGLNCLINSKNSVLAPGSGFSGSEKIAYSTKYYTYWLRLLLSRLTSLVDVSLLGSP